MPLEKAGVGASGHELGVPKDSHQQIAVGDEAVNSGALETESQQSSSLIPGLGPRHHLGDHRVVERGDLASALNSGIDPETGKTRKLESVQSAGNGQEVLKRVLGVDPGFDRMTDHRRAQGVLRQGLTLGDQYLQADQVEGGDLLGHRMLDLEPGVHLEEEELFVVV